MSRCSIALALVLIGIGGTGAHAAGFADQLKTVKKEIRADLQSRMDTLHGMGFISHGTVRSVVMNPSQEGGAFGYAWVNVDGRDVDVPCEATLGAEPHWHCSHLNGHDD